MTAAELFWLCPLAPFAVFVLLLFAGHRSERGAARLALGAMAVSVLVASLVLAGAAAGDRAAVAIPWMVAGERRFSFALALDPLAAVMALLVSVVAFVVFSYAATYMQAERRRFFALLSLFAAAMLALVMAADLVTLIVTWELVGLCSYLLIGFRVRETSAAAAATKALLTTRLADLAMIAGGLLWIGTTGSADIPALLSGVMKLDPALRLTIAMLLFIGAAAKSAQVPFQGWLPDAMAGPTPVSALLHSATMVAAGVFLIARLNPLFAADGAMLHVIAWTGAATAMLGASAALVQTDLKRLLAYSTMSQLGLMFVGLGAGSVAGAVLLLIAQAFYKAALFLAAGSIEHQAGSRDLARMGGLARCMPLTAIAFAIAAAALAGLPVTWALAPKEPVLAAAFRSNPLLYAVAMLASFLTALYSGRAAALVFLGERAVRDRCDEAPRGFVVPTLAMAALVPVALTVDAGWLGRPLEALLGTSTLEAHTVTTTAFAAAASGVLLALLGHRLWPHALVWPPLRIAMPAMMQEWGFRPLYARLAAGAVSLTRNEGALDRTVFDPFAQALARGALEASRRTAGFDSRRFDAPLQRFAARTLALVGWSGRFDRRRMDRGVEAFAQSLLRMGQRVRGLQTGHVDNYLTAVFGWTIALVMLCGAIALSRL